MEEDQVPKHMRYEQVQHHDWGTAIHCGTCGDLLVFVSEGVLTIEHKVRGWDGPENHITMVKLSKLIGR